MPNSACAKLYACAMPYQDFALADFLMDDTFVEWATTGTHDAFWQGILEKYPHQQPTIETAKAILREGNTQWSATERADLRTRLEEVLFPAPDSIATPSYANWWVVGVCGVLLMAAAGWWYSAQQQAIPPTAPAMPYQQLLQAAATPLREVHNPHARPMYLQLEDGSNVWLQAGSHLSYPAAFEGHSQRVVYLSGEAFFEVAKDAKRPFLVYAQEVVTKVLGTSFRVKAYSQDAEVVVTVKTGRVAVFANERFAGQRGKGQPAEVVLLPKQQIAVNRQQPAPTNAQVQVPAAQSLPPLQTLTFDFDDTPIGEVFARLERAYGVRIAYDAKRMANCRLTASMTDEPFAEKLRLICLTVEANFHWVNEQVVIEGQGCQ